MRIEHQVCTLEQAKRLKELGVFENAFGSWVYDTTNEKWGISKLNVEQMALANSREAYPAFTVAELMIMLPKRYMAVKNLVSKYPESSWHCQYIQDDDVIRDFFYPHKIYDKENHNYGLGFTTQAKALCAMLIYLLENNHITSEQVNQRLNG